MSPTTFILLSPPPVDGYPPVQYQARLLAEAGHRVFLVTSTRRDGETVPDFTSPGVEVRALSAAQYRSRRLTRTGLFVARLLEARLRAGRGAVEICYDPIGGFISDVTPWRPRLRILHLHELLQNFDTLHLEHRLRQTVHGFARVVVPDESRAAHTADVLRLATRPLVIENYPLRVTAPMPRRDTGRFEVVYCGSLGLNQKLDMLIRSVPLWPETAHLVLIGNDTTPIGRQLHAMVAEAGLQKRVHFLGWMETSAAEQRLADADLAVAIFDDSSEQLRTALGASNKRFQYMKAGLPQIGDMNPGVTELLDGIGVCLSAHDPEEMAGLVAAYAADPERCRAEGTRAFERHREKYNYEQVFTRLTDWVEAVT
ncbi:glycosyltransferase (plasmid) [Limimaricola variabilis]|uniref:glycosyltransferase n=1 Tax=Limimaricola variabilis TaxID=1492771 RepID=UPI002AC93DF2|nr:glycosyltransferase [Limimaricola variabilis]WPY96231.1 glycosyltransferase [Limimaricola variabilis]